MQKTEYLRMALTPGYLKNLKSDRNQQVSDMVLPGLQFRYSAGTGRKVFYLQYRVRGTNKQRHMRLGTLVEFTLGDIRGMALNLKREIANGHDPQIAQRQRAVEAAEREARRQKVKELAPIFLERHCRENNRANTYKSNEALMRLYIIPYLGDACVEDIDLTLVQDTYDKIKNAKTVAVADHMIRLLSTFLNWCEKYKHRQINTNPCRHVQKAKGAKFKHTVLDMDGYKRLFAALDEALADGVYAPQAILAIKAIALTGCRSGEITNLEYDELDLVNGYLRLNKRKTDAFNVPLGGPAIDVINSALDICRGKQYVFHSPIDHTRPIVDLRRAFWWALRRAGLPHMRIHDLRHSFATLATSMGEDIRVLRDVLGHTKITTTEIYAHTSNTAARQTANNVATAIMG